MQDEGEHRRYDTLESVIAIARLGYCSLDVSTRRLAASAQFKAEFGWPADQALDEAALLDRLHPASREEWADAIRAALGAQVDLRSTVRAVWPDGSVQWISITGRAVGEGSEPASVLLVSRNVTAEREQAEGDERAHVVALENERALRTRAEAANRGKDRFLSVFSHELRSPLNSILGWNRILSMKRADDTEVASITTRIETSARAQLKMVNDLLDLARIEAGKLRIEPRPMQLAPVVAAAADLARPAASAKSLSLGVHIHPGSGALRGDPDRLQQVVVNLLSNAIKFTPSGGSIDVTLRNASDAVELAVCDSGQGIAADLLPHVFDRFRQGDDSSTRQAGGLGLGLAVVREIVVLHGGTVVASSPGSGQGATFVVRLPARVAWQAGESGISAGQAGPAAASGESLAGLSILVVDDEPDARLVVSETLRLEGAHVTATDSAASALARIRQPGAHFDVLVTDIGMPDEDGYSLVRRVRALGESGRMLAVAVTGYASKADVAAAMDAGFDLHVPKPLDFNAFVPQLRGLADGRQGQISGKPVAEKRSGLYSPPNGGSSASATRPDGGGAKLT